MSGQEFSRYNPSTGKKSRNEEVGLGPTEEVGLGPTEKLPLQQRDGEQNPYNPRVVMKHLQSHTG